MKLSGILLMMMIGLLPSFAAETSMANLLPAPLAAKKIEPANRLKNKQNFFQRVRARLVKKMMVRSLRGTPRSAKQKRQARLSLILGLISVAFLLAPFTFWLALPAAVPGLIFGIRSVDGNSNAEGIIGIVASGVTLSIFLIVGIVFLTIGLATIN